MEEKKVNVLIIDDDGASASALKLVLDKSGYSVSTASNGEKGLEIAKGISLQVIITALRMPGMDGIEVLRKIKEINSSISVIVISSYATATDVTRTIQEGAFDYVTKPFKIEELKIILKRAVERHYLLKEAGQKDYYRELSIMDGLTGVYNHRYLHEIFPREIERAKRYPQQISVLMLDIDDFKKYNDNFGHMAGDKILKEFAQLFVKAIRCVDMVFRYGGEEFVILLPQTPKSGAVEAANRIINLSRLNMPVSVSIGISAFPDNGGTKDELIDKADKALYQAKRSGKNRVCIFEE